MNEKWYNPRHVTAKECFCGLNVKLKAWNVSVSLTDRILFHYRCLNSDSWLFFMFWLF